MPKLRILSGSAVVKIFYEFGFNQARQKGSHIKLGRKSDGVWQTLTIPKHRELDRGTLRAIYNQALRYLPESDLRPCFYQD